MTDKTAPLISATTLGVRIIGTIGLMTKGIQAAPPKDPAELRTQVVHYLTTVLPNLEILPKNHALEIGQKIVAVLKATFADDMVKVDTFIRNDDDFELIGKALYKAHPGIGAVIPSFAIFSKRYAGNGRDHGDTAEHRAGSTT